MKSAWYAIIGLLIFISCSDDDTNNDPPTQQGFYALKVGNYWKYQYNQTDFEGNPTQPAAIEEITVIDKVTLNGSEYYQLKIETQQLGPECFFCESEPIVNEFVRDSLGYLINSSNDILFSHEQQDPYIIEEARWGTIYGKLLTDSETVTVDAGSFSCIVNEIYSEDENGNPNSGVAYYHYSDGTGIIKQTCVSVVNNIQVAEKVLLEYSLE